MFRIRSLVLIIVAATLVGGLTAWGLSHNQSGGPPATPQALTLTPPAAQEILKTCAGVEVRSISASVEFERKALLHATPKIEILPSLTSASTPAAVEREVKLNVFGPVLGSMDSREVKTDVACTAKGFVLTAGVTRSADYEGAAAKNVLWRPKIEVVVTARQPEVVFEATWVMRLTTGAKVDHAQTPSYPDQKYPITLTKTIRISS